MYELGARFSGIFTAKTNLCHYLIVVAAKQRKKLFPHQLAAQFISDRVVQHMAPMNYISLIRKKFNLSSLKRDPGPNTKH